MILSFLFFIVQLLSFGTFNVRADGRVSLPVSIRAASRPDYSRDSQALEIPPISGNILQEIIADLEGTGSLEDRMAILLDELSSPVPTRSLDFQPPSVVSPTLPVAASTPMSVTFTSPTPFSTATSYATPTSLPAYTNTPSNPLLPASTPVPQKTRKSRPTHPPKPTKKP
jgi:hypothetical protein